VCLYVFVLLDFLAACYSTSENGDITTLGSTQPVTEMSTKGIIWAGGGVVRRPMPRDDNLATFMCRFSRNYDSLKLLEP
jgi:hypothetical protein